MKTLNILNPTSNILHVSFMLILLSYFLVCVSTQLLYKLTAEVKEPESTFEELLNSLLSVDAFCLWSRAFGSNFRLIFYKFNFLTYKFSHLWNRHDYLFFLKYYFDYVRKYIWILFKLRNAHLILSFPSSIISYSSLIYW